MLEELNERIKECRKCRLWKFRKNAVPGMGNPEARIMLIGEAPGAKEDETGLPFVGKAGKLLDEILAELGFDRTKLYITNVVKCRPPHNRDPFEDEILACKPYLDAQIGAIKPLKIVCLGRIAARVVFKKFGVSFDGLSSDHGVIKKINTLWGTLLLMATYHPAAALYNPSLRSKIKEDLKEILVRA